MNIKQIPKQPLKHSPYDEDVCGFHEGDAVEIQCGEIIILVQEYPSGLGPSYHVTITHPQQLKPKHALSAFVDDDGVFVSNVENL